MLTVRVDLDLLAINNFLLTSVTFLLVTILLGRKIIWQRLFLVSILSTLLLYVFVLNPDWHPATVLIFHLISTGFFVFLLLNPVSLFQILKGIILAYLLASAGAGLSMLVFSVSRGPLGFWFSSFFSVGSMTFYYIFLSLVGLVFICWRVFNWVNDSLLQGKKIVDLRIFFKGKKVEVKAFIDTGNQLKDPLTGFPVIVIEDKVIKSFFSEEFSWELEGLTRTQELSGIKFRLIPYASIKTEGSGLLPGFRPDYIELSNGNKPAIRTDLVVLGISKGNLSLDYQALVPPAIFQYKEG